MTRILSIDESEVIFDDDSEYSGRDGMRAFRACAGWQSASPGRGKLLEERLGTTLPASLFDLVEEGGFVSRWACFAHEPDRIGWLSDVGAMHLGYLPLVSRKVWDTEYVWHTSKLFVEKYSSREGTDGCTLACPSWFPRMLLLGEGKAGELFLANPVVKSLDREWEGWLWCHRYPGAYRFSSIAELVGHCFMESRNRGGDCPRFGRETFKSQCPERLFSGRHA